MINTTRAFLLLLLIVPTALHADAITMRASVRMRANGEPLRLKDIARFTGEKVNRFADLRVASGVASLEAFEIHVEEVKGLLEEAGVNWAQVELAGGITVVRPRSTSAARMGLNLVDESDAVKPEIAEGVQSALGKASDPMATFASLGDWAGTSPVIDEIIELVRSEWRDQAGRVHLDIDTVALDRLPSNVGTIMVRSRGTTLGVDWFDVQVRFTPGAEGLRPTQTILCRVETRLMTDTTIAARDLRTRRVLQIADMQTAPKLLKPTDAMRMLEPSSLVGRKLVEKVESTTPILWSSIEPEIIVKRNDSVRVVMEGAFSLSGTDAVALERGSVGDRIKCRWRMGDDPFLAVITAPGEVRAGG